MYSVYAGTTCIYDDTSNAQNLRLINPVLELADSAAGSFKMTVPVTNIGYDLIERLETTISVRKDEQEMWEGRVIDESIDYWKNRTLTCEGELAYLNDTIQPPAEYHDLTVRGFLETLLAIHNEKVPVSRQFEVGAVTVTDPNDSLYRYTNYEKTIECINDKLIDRLGGHLSIRKENGVRYLDYLADKQSTNTQIIEFGENLLDYTASFDMTEFATVLVPLGARLDESPISALEAYTTIASVNEGRIYVINASAYMNYGWIEKVVHFDRVTEPSNLLRKAREYLSEIQFDTMVLEVKAIDLHYMNPAIEGVKLTDQIRVVSEPHGLNRVFPVMKLSIPLDQPENTVFTLGDAVKTSLTDVNNKTNSEIIERINEMPTKQSVLDEARENAQAIMDLISNGFITITHDENGSQQLFISDTQDLDAATRFWRWNINGLAYGTKQSTDPISSAVYSIAMTMDGSIVADMITAGTLRADLLDAIKVKASTFILQNETDPSSQGETLSNVIQRFELADGQLISEISGLSQVAVKTVEVYYALGDSQTIPPSATANWSTTAPAWEEGKYMWQKTLTIFADDTVQNPHRSWSNPTCIQGAAGQDGAPGEAGVGVSRIVPEYYLSTSASSQQGGSWTTTCPAWESGKYIWTRSHVYYDDNTDSTTTPVLDNAVNSLGQSTSEIKQKLDSITLSVTNGQTSSTIKLMAGQTEISSQNIQMSGLVSFTDLSGTGASTFINGANIITGTISADAIKVRDIYAPTEYEDDDKLVFTSVAKGSRLAEIDIGFDPDSAGYSQNRTDVNIFGRYVMFGYGSSTGHGLTIDTINGWISPYPDSSVALGTSSNQFLSVYTRNIQIYDTQNSGWGELRVQNGHLQWVDGAGSRTNLT